VNKSTANHPTLNFKPKFGLKLSRLLISLMALFGFGVGFGLNANNLEQEPQTTEDLEWGTVLFDFYQKNYLSALIEYDYVHAKHNSMAKSQSGRLLKGGMLLSYGMADRSEAIFESLLDDNVSTSVKNSAWYYLANLYYHKADNEKAFNAIQKIQGDVSPQLHTEYHYLATLINSQGKHLGSTEKLLTTLSPTSHYYAYVLFNLSISQLEAGEIEEAIASLNKVASMSLSQTNPELVTLADRARHGLAQITLRQGDVISAWTYLKSITTTGLYSNRALLTYAWTAIKLKQFQQAIPALSILDERSIALPEVQEAKVLLAHLYEQEGSPRKALKSNLLAIEAFTQGLEDLKEARRIISLQNVPKEFVSNFDVIVGKTDWYAMEPTVDYLKLTPFVIDLVASHGFNETLTELSDLYTIQNNLDEWSTQSKEHVLILQNSEKKSFSNTQKTIIEKSEALKKKLVNQKADLELYALTLNEEDQKRLSALVESTNKELALLDSRILQLKQVKQPYQQPKKYKKILAKNHKKIKQKLKETNQYITMLEPVIRKLINTELDKHENRMRYYLAQSKLAKARLYDTTLMLLDKAKKDSNKEKSKNNEGKK